MAAPPQSPRCRAGSTNLRLLVSSRSHWAKCCNKKRRHARSCEHTQRLIDSYGQTLGFADPRMAALLRFLGGLLFSAPQLRLQSPRCRMLLPIFVRPARRPDECDQPRTAEQQKQAAEY